MLKVTSYVIFKVIGVKDATSNSYMFGNRWGWNFWTGRRKWHWNVCLRCSWILLRGLRWRGDLSYSMLKVDWCNLDTGSIGHLEWSAILFNLCDPLLCDLGSFYTNNLTTNAPTFTPHKLACQSFGRSKWLVHKLSGIHHRGTQRHRDRHANISWSSGPPCADPGGYESARDWSPRKGRRYRASYSDWRVFVNIPGRWKFSAPEFFCLLLETQEDNNKVIKIKWNNKLWY